ncbi:hypothetical protein AMJ82_08940 [candidate division TA06 bacterium SM23_40]|uniref:Uncharacterized protein n=1 Tax=candidate division TA06 bacterium SM23_40 TaxID=1703774 RepID=A0A0S8G6J1_UNCT6|nr:MAG: hypothetical protein AMJ82_08940 [candidate division TA06 bacterium SM23_40]
MANPRWNPQKKRKGPPTGQEGGKVPSWNERTAAWPGVPGKTQPRDRSGGTKKIKQSMKTEGV